MMDFSFRNFSFGTWKYFSKPGRPRPSPLSPSFADIFYNNCFQNGLLPVRLGEDAVEDLFQRISRSPGNQLTVDLEKCEIRDAAGLKLPFVVDPFRRHCLLNGLDSIGLTLENENQITDYERAHQFG